MQALASLFTCGHPRDRGFESLLLSTEKQNGQAKNACPFCLAEEDDSFNSGASKQSLQKRSVYANKLCYRTLCVTHTTLRVYLFAMSATHDFRKCYALASLFAVYASPTAQMRQRAIARNTSCYVCLLCPLRTISANATRLRPSLLAVSTERWFDTQCVLAVFFLKTA